MIERFFSIETFFHRRRLNEASSYRSPDSCEAEYDPDNTVANVPAEPPAGSGHGPRDNAASLVASGGGLPSFILEFAHRENSGTSTPESLLKAYSAIEDARYGDNFIVVAHPLASGAMR